MNKFRSLLLVLFCLTIDATPLAAQDEAPENPRPVAAAVYLEGALSIDGDREDAYLTAPAISTPVSVEMHNALEEGQEPSLATARALWNGDGLYFFVEVSDDAISIENGAPWEQDSVEFFIDQNGERSTTFQPDDGQYRVSAEGRRTWGEGVDARNFEAVVVKTETGYNVEAMIRLGAIEPNADTRIGFDLQVNNDPGSGSRKSVFKFSDPTDETWRNTSLFGSLVLAADQAQAEAVASDARAPELSPDAAEMPSEADSETALLSPAQRVPEWARDAVFYQLFPERFRNGDPTNDPTRESLEFVDIMPQSWRVTPWTSQWYARDKWEEELGDDFYADGVFHRRFGGDLQGVIDKLDYIDQLGINVIYFNPVFYARSLHKYDGNSFHHIDPHFGPDPAGDFAIMQTESADPATWKVTAADQLFFDLIRAAHEREIRIVIDGVFNHTGRDFFAFADIAASQQNSQYLDWYNVEQFDDPATPANEFRYQCWWGVDTLPEFADNAAGDDLHPAPKSYVFTATRKWMDPDGDGDPSDGIDGWRLDVANEVPDKFWQDWNQMIRDLNPEVFTVAEIWDDAGDYLSKCGFSSTMNYHGFAFPVKGFFIDNRMSASHFAEEIQQRMQAHPAEVQYSLQNLIDSHDTDRVASMIVNAKYRHSYLSPGKFDYDVGERVVPRHFAPYDISVPDETERRIQKLVVLFQMTFVGPPMIYYGSEAGMDGADDPDDRMPMVWDDLEYEARTLGPFGPTGKSEAIAFNAGLHDYYCRAIALRNDMPELRRGGFRLIQTDAEKGLFSFVRESSDGAVFVAFNRSADDAEFAAPVGEYSNAVLVFDSNSDVNEPGSVTRVQISEAASIEVQSLSGTVWRLEK
ncbi:MAG: alpha-amylase family glycosyl hydrolase [Planctomycetota bacterium]